VSTKLGIFDLLDEETTLQQGSDENFVNKVTNNHSASLILVKISSNEPQFGIRHFAGTVILYLNFFLS
jgi:myosin heavy subunit